MVVEPLLAECLLAVTLSLMVGQACLVPVQSIFSVNKMILHGDTASHLYMTFLCLLLAY